MMKHLIGLAACLLIFSASVFGQSVNRSQYGAIDPFDYRLDEFRAQRGWERKFKSVVRYQDKNTRGTTYFFISLDQTTPLTLTISDAVTREPDVGQTVTIYYTATGKGMNRDNLVLDEIDFNNTTEAGIGLTKSPVPTSHLTVRTNYTEITLFDYRTEEETAERGEMRKYKTTVLFSKQEGLFYSFAGREGEKPISFQVARRFPSLTRNQRVTIYYTATKGSVRDTLVLDDIAL